MHPTWPSPPAWSSRTGAVSSLPAPVSERSVCSVNSEEALLRRAQDGPVAVTGASGYVGAHVVLNLVDHGYDVRCCVRDANNPLKTAHLLAMNKFGAPGSVTGVVATERARFGIDDDLPRKPNQSDPIPISIRASRSKWATA